MYGTGEEHVGEWKPEESSAIRGLRIGPGKQYYLEGPVRHSEVRVQKAIQK